MCAWEGRVYLPANYYFTKKVICLMMLRQRRAKALCDRSIVPGVDAHGFGSGVLRFATGVSTTASAKKEDAAH